MSQNSQLPSVQAESAYALLESQSLEKHLVLSKIEAIFVSFMDDLTEKRGSLSIPVKARSKKEEPGLPTQNSAIEPLEMRRVTFPGISTREAKRFARLLRILELIYEALVNDTVTTKRCFFLPPANLY
ncbi:hypothetical protein MMC06_005541 [Schaereria dolodes]|nr:hypothetical protein [Schaereria dolodes]